MKFRCNAKDLWDAIVLPSKYVDRKVGLSGSYIVCKDGEIFIQDHDYNVTVRAKVEGEAIEDGIVVISDYKLTNSPIQFMDGEIVGEYMEPYLVLNDTRIKVLVSEFNTIEQLDEPFVVQGSKIFLPPEITRTTWATNDKLPHYKCLYIAPQHVGCTNGVCMSWVDVDTNIKETIAVTASGLPDFNNMKVYATDRHMWIIGDGFWYRTCTIEVGDYISPQIDLRLNSYDLVFEMPITNEFMQAIRRMHVLTKSVSDDGLAAIDVKNGILFMESQPSEMGYDSIELPVEWNGPDVSMSFRPGQIAKMYADNSKLMLLRGTEEDTKGNQTTFDVIMVTDEIVYNVSAGCTSEWRQNVGKEVDQQPE